MGRPLIRRGPARRAVVLLTGFEPFGRHRMNSSWEAIAPLDGRTVAGARVVARRLPVSYARAGRALRRLLAESRPRVAVAFGMHAGSGILLERVALNLEDSRHPDNDGRRRRDAPISARGPVAYLSGLPLRALERALRRARLPARLSNSAGAYLCNHVFYRLMEAAAHARGPSAAGFVHLPPIRGPGVAGRRGLPLAALRRAAGKIVETVVRKRPAR
ncbi:MAG: hypothetical protein L0216_21860 [Planctomycetales bacterium]|nr:hypothetical protein [Planctomycetales bacterium]